MLDNPTQDGISMGSSIVGSLRTRLMSTKQTKEMCITAYGLM